MPCYKFGQFKYDTSTGVLQKSDTETILRAKNAQLLEIMLSSGNKVLTKEDLYVQLWGESVVLENSLPKLINELRFALSDSAKDSKFIKTWPKKGYQFLGDVSIYEYKENKLRKRVYTAAIIVLISILAIYQFVIPTNSIPPKTDELEITPRELFLLGMDYQRRSEDRVFHLKALEQYKKAVDKNPEYAQAWAQLLS